MKHNKFLRCIISISSVLILLAFTAGFCYAATSIKQHKLLLKQWPEMFKTQDYLNKLILLKKSIEGKIDWDLIVLKSYISTWTDAEKYGLDPYKEITKGIRKSKKWIEVREEYYDTFIKAMEEIKESPKEYVDEYNAIHELFSVCRKSHVLSLEVPRDSIYSFIDKIDSITSEYIDCLRKIEALETMSDGKTFAFRRLKFGDSQEIVNNKLIADVKFKKLSFGDSYEILVGNYYYFIHFEYYNGGLYKITFSSPERDATYFETDVKNYWQNLVNVISEKYGEKPGIYKEIFELEPGYVHFTHIWQDDGKEIRIGVGEFKSGYQYYAHASITDSAIEQHIEKTKTRSKEIREKISSGDF